MKYNRNQQSSISERTTIWAPWLSLLAAVCYLYVNLFTHSRVPILFFGDQTFFLVYAQRILHGERIYQDFFQFTPPGTDLVYFAIFRLFGVHLWIINLLVLLLGLALTYLCFKLAARLMNQHFALQASAIFLVLIYGSLLDATHHWFSVLLSLCAVQTLMPARTLGRIAIAGALMGLASFFTQTNGVAAVIAIAIALACEQMLPSLNQGTQHTRKIAQNLVLLIASAIGIWAALSGYWIGMIGWRRLWYFEITYPRYYVGSGLHLISGMIGSLSDLAQHLFIYILTISIYPLVLWLCWRRRREISAQQGIQILLVCLTGLLLLLGVIAKLNWNRLYIVSMPAIILFVWCIAHLRRLRLYVATVLWILIFSLAAKRTLYRHQHANYIVDLPAGKAALSSLSAERFLWLKQHTNPGESLLQAQNLDTYTPLQLRNPISADGLWPFHSTRPEFVELAIRQIEQKQVKYILWSPWLVATERPDHEDQNPLNPFHAYLLDHYVRVHIFSNSEEVWQRR
jgi:hypothetical protein